MDSHASSEFPKQSKKETELGPGVDPIPTPKQPLSSTAKLEDLVGALMNGDTHSQQPVESSEKN
ncbi:hypothetical protein J41TS12_49500 [Paenibacillus antibioticophila]|uniref:Uncharacterized protein n=1 Tax=Paenibacillus antibioticophila TaxID=1274374 RepID=A0A920CK33_9BACL|nr:hypothetical protein [Paenibacillus antibioticophila]GIO40089.1 hypothetical protein J41TS12_49500 [Paenibacillus antibioticophila]